MAVINSWCEKVARLINANFEISALVANQGAIRGDARENFIKEVLAKFLPANVVFGSGEIIDAYGGRSKQIDLIIYRNDFPVLRTGGSSDVYLIEGVVAVIEVKSSLNEHELFSALENSKSVKNLRPTFLANSLDLYTQCVYAKDYENLSISKKNSVMGMLLPPTYIFSYRGYTKSSLKKFKTSLNDWHCCMDGRGEYSMDILPEVIVTEACVALKNIGDQLCLGHADQEDLNRLIKAFAYTFGQTVTVEDLFDISGAVYDSGFTYGLGVKIDDNPLQYLISSLLEMIALRVGQQRFGSLPITYNLMEYYMTGQMEGDWEGAALNFIGITCPRKDFYQKLIESEELL